jgi:hypothetical protein
MVDALLISFRPQIAFCRNFDVNRAEGGQVDGIACAAYRSRPPRNSADVLELAENGVFLDRVPISAPNRTVDGH